jgi:NAD(P)-dependent dehydrogenase (short-subunit alcohol dehydrogenase family)
VTVSRRTFLQSTAALAAPGIAGCGPDSRQADGVPMSEFGSDSTADQVTAGLDLSGRLAVVTGCNSGIGYETMRVLAMRGAYVVGTGRTLDRARDACASVQGVTTPVELELGDLDSVVRCAETIRSLNTPVDMLICNAGMRRDEYALSGNLERHFAVNHLGHFLLVNRLLDRLYLASQGRVVVVSSRAAYTSAPDDGIQFDDLAMSNDWSVSRAYAHSKLANALFSYELARLLKGTRITSNALHPGVIATNIIRDASAPVRFGFSMLTSLAGKTIEEGAATTCFVATHPSLGEVSGEFFVDCNAVRIEGDHHLYDRDQASRLWSLSEALVGDRYVQHERPDWDAFRNGVREVRSPDANGADVP